MKNKIFAMLIIVVMLSVTSISAFATTTTYQVAGTDLTINLPENTYVFTAGTDAADPQWAEAGIENAPEIKNMYTELGSIVHFSKNGANVYINKLESETTETYGNLAAMTDAELELFVEGYNAEDEYAKTTAKLIDHAQMPFVEMEVIGADENGDTVYQHILFTIVNGYSLSFNQIEFEEITQEQIDFSYELLANSTIAFTLTGSTTDMTSPMAIASAVIALVVFFGLVVFFIYAGIATKKSSKLTKMLANKLTEYRQERAGKENTHGSLVFENTTEYNDRAVRQYSVFQSYIKRPFAVIFPMALTLLSFIAIAGVDSEWWLVLLVFATVIYCLYRLITASSTLAKATRRAMSKFRSKTATYRFYENEFSISGLQYNEFYPYFQITDFREYKDYFYIYFGDSNAYYIEKSKFTFADKEDFKGFIKEQIKKGGLK